MREIPILAYYYGKDEEDLILQYVKVQEKTASFIFGLIKMNDIAQLKKKGVLVDIVQTSTDYKDGLGRIFGRIQGQEFFIIRKMRLALDQSRRKIFT